MFYTAISRSAERNIKVSRKNHTGHLITTKHPWCLGLRSICELHVLALIGATNAPPCLLFASCSRNASAVAALALRALRVSTIIDGVSSKIIDGIGTTDHELRRKRSLWHSPTKAPWMPSLSLGRRSPTRCARTGASERRPAPTKAPTPDEPIRSGNGAGLRTTQSHRSVPFL